MNYERGLTRREKNTWNERHVLSKQKESTYLITGLIIIHFQ